MKVSFPVMRGNMGGRQYYSLLIPLSEIPHLFKFDDWEQCTPELRAQRVLNKARVPDIQNTYSIMRTATYSRRSQHPTPVL